MKNLIPIDYTNFDKVDEDINKDSKQALRSMNLNDFRLAASVASEEVYSRLMKILDKNKEARELIFLYSHLTFCYYEIHNVRLSDIDHAKEVICNIFTPELKAKKEKQLEAIIASLPSKTRKLAKKAMIKA